MCGQGFAQFIPLILIFIIFYFFLIRPQQKRVKDHKIMVDSLKRGDEVIVPSHTFHATWLAVSNIGAIPVPVEISENDFNIDINLIEKKITKILDHQKRWQLHILMSIPNT